MIKFFRCVGLFLLAMVLPATASASSAIEGVWQHSEKPAWLKIQFEKGEGVASVYRHDNNQHAKGLIVLKNIAAQSNSTTQWRGKMYAAHLNGFIDANLVLIEPNQLEITMINGSDIEILQLIREK